MVEYEVAGDSESEISNMEDEDCNPDKKVKSRAKLKCVECPKTYNSSRGLRAHKQKFHWKVETQPPSNVQPVVLVDNGETLHLVENVDIEYVNI